MRMMNLIHGVSAVGGFHSNSTVEGHYWKGYSYSAVKNFPAFMDTEGSSLCSQTPNTKLHHEPHSHNAFLSDTF